MEKLESAGVSVVRTRRTAETTRRALLAAATEEFAARGFSGARIERIAARADCNIRMLYKHFGSKDALYMAVLEAAYKHIRAKEQDRHFEGLDPVEGLLSLYDFTFTHFANNPQFVQLLSNENLMKGTFVTSSPQITAMTSPLISQIKHFLKIGYETGRITRHIDHVQLYATIAALCWFHLSNAYTLSAMFGKDLTSKKWRENRRKHGRQVIRSFLTYPIDKS